MAGTAAAGITLLLPRSARSSSHPWGELHAEAWPGSGGDALPAADGVTTGYKILEIFAYGGLSPWETFYVDDDAWRGLRDDFEDLRGACADGVPETQEFAGSETVGLGWPTSPLWYPGGSVSTTLLNRMRVVVLRHDLLPHEAAIPLNLTGLPLGNPRLAGSAAVVGRRTLAVSGDTFPASCVLMPTGVAIGDNFAAASAVGQLDASAAPLVLTVGPGGSSLLTTLQRGGDTPRIERRDQLAAAYAEAYANRLSVGDQRLRSSSFGQYEVLRNQLSRAPELRTMLTGTSLAPPDADGVCSGPGATLDLADHSQAAISSATYLLRQPAGPRYVGVVERGYRDFNGAGYDAHSANAQAVGVDFRRTLEVLVGEIDSGNLDLDDTLVVLSTEFGRTPVPSGDGRDHHPYGYVSVLLGGPIGRGGSDAQAYVGSIGGDGSALAGASYVPADLRAALYMAAGINPLQPSEVLSIGDLSAVARGGGRTDEEVQQNIARTFFGIG
jgi:hypothetical protein